MVRAPYHALFIALFHAPIVNVILALRMVPNLPRNVIKRPLFRLEVRLFNEHGPDKARY